MSTQKYYKNRLGFDPREEIDYPHSPSPMKGSPARGGSYDDYGSPVKKSRQSTPANESASSQGGYEDTLTQYKGTKSVWEYFVEHKDRLGMSKIKHYLCVTNHLCEKMPKNLNNIFLTRTSMPNAKKCCVTFVVLLLDVVFNFNCFFL